MYCSLHECDVVLWEAAHRQEKKLLGRDGKVR